MVYNIETTTMLTGSIQGNEVKVIFNPRIQKLFVGDSLKIIDESGQGVVAQIYELENYDSSTEDLKLKSQVESYLSVTDENSLDDLGSIHIANCILKYSILKNKWIKWRGNLPSLTDYVEVLTPKEVIVHSIGSTPLNQAFIGNYPNTNSMPVRIEASFLEGISLISASNDTNKSALLSAVKLELLQKEAKILFIDFKGRYSNINTLQTIQAGKNYKLQPNNYPVNQDNSWMFVNDQDETLSLGNEFLNTKELVLNLSNIDTNYQESFINQAINDLIKNETCVFVIFDDIPNTLSSALFEKMVYLNKNHLVNFVICTTGEFELPCAILKYADNYFLFASDGFSEGSPNYNNLKSDKKLLSRLLKYLPDNAFILYGELTSNYPLLVELDESSFVSLKPRYFGSVRKQISESGEIIYSYNANNSVAQQNIPKQESAPKQDSYLDTYKALSQEYEDDEVDLEDDSDEDDFDYDAREDEDDQDTYNNEDTIDEHDEVEEKPYYYEEEDEDEVPVIKIQPTKKAPASKQKAYHEEIYQPERVPQKFSKPKKEPVHKENISKQQPEPPKKQAKSQPKQAPVKNIAPRAEAIPDHIDDIPVYSDPTISESSDKFQEGDHVMHERYGVGVINRVITTGDKQLCSIQFQDYGRRLLDPNRGLQKIE